MDMLQMKILFHPQTILCFINNFILREIYMLFNKISFLIFIISLSVGLFMIYFLEVEDKKVYVYPGNDTNYTIRDKSGTCFKLSEQEVQCSGNEFQIPVQ